MASTDNFYTYDGRTQVCLSKALGIVEEVVQFVREMREKHLHFFHGDVEAIDKVNEVVGKRDLLVHQVDYQL